MNRKLYIIGAGSVGGHIAYNINYYNEDYEIVGFLDDNPEKIGSLQFGYKVIGPIDLALKLENVNIAIGIAFPGIKKKIVEKVKSNRSLLFPVFIHEKAWVSDLVNIGNGTIIYPGTSVNYGCSVGDFVVINMNCAIGHHTQIGAYSSLAPNVGTGGHTNIGKCVEMGIGSCTLQNVIIHDHSIIGGQAMVIDSVPENSVAVGVPAKIFEK